MDMLSSRHNAHPAEKISFICLFHAEIMSRISQNLSRKVGGILVVKRNADVIAKKRRRDMYQPNVNGGMSFSLFSESAVVCIGVVRQKYSGDFR